MIIRNHLSPKEYLTAVKERMSGHFELGQERFTGFFLGRLLFVTHHAGYEWNRRITNQKNAALGYVKSIENGCEIRFLRFQGMLCPQYLIPYLLVFGGMLALCWQALADLPALICFYILILLGTPLLSTVIESMTDGSVDGQTSLMGLLIDPTDYFAALHHQNEIR